MRLAIYAERNVIKKLRYQATAFVVIGSVGFVIDGSVLTLLSIGAGVNVYISRLISFALASLVTWQLNRRHTFRQTGKITGVAQSSEYIRYVLVQTGGALLNLGVFSWLIVANPALQAIPIIPFAGGASVALFFNFIGARIWVFQS